MDTTHRLERGTRRKPVNLGLTVEEAKRDSFRAIAAANEMSAAALFEAVVDHLEELGGPTWLPPKDRSGELPIDPD